MFLNIFKKILVQAEIERDFQADMPLTNHLFQNRLKQETALTTLLW
jgi:hypothetical protein